MLRMSDLSCPSGTSRPPQPSCDRGSSARKRVKYKSGTGGAFADGFFREQSLLADAVGNFGEFALIGTNRGQVVGLANEIESAQSFPDLFVARIDGGDFGAGGYVRAGRREECADASADGRAQLEGSQLVLRSFGR